MAFDSAAPINRRTVTKGIAWSVPAVAIASTAPAFAVSKEVPDEPTFNWADACATTGDRRGCSGEQKTPQVQVEVKNETLKTLQFQVLEQKSWKDGTMEPTSFSQGDGMFLDTGSQKDCGSRLDFIGCGGYYSITLAPGETKNIWVVGRDMGSSDAFRMKIKWRWVEVTTVGGATVCGNVVGVPPIGYGIATPDLIIPNNNCG